MSNDESTLSVLPNPYAHLDARGRPSAALALEGMGGRDRYVGAQVDHARTQKLGRVVFVPEGYEAPKGAGEAHLMAAWAAVQPLKVPDTAYYRRALRFGTDLLPGNAETRDRVGLPEKTPVGADALAKARADAAARYRAAHDKAPAFELAAQKAADESTNESGGDAAPKETAP